MTDQTLQFDLLAKDSASGAFRDMGASAAAAAAEMHAAFAAPLEVKVDTSAYDSLMTKWDEVKVANEASVARIAADAERLRLAVDKSITDSDALLEKFGNGAPTRMERVGAAINQHIAGAFANAGKKVDAFRKKLDELGGNLLKFGGGELAGGALLGAPSVLALGGLASGLTGAVGAGGILGLAGYGAIEGYSKLNTQITTLRSSMASLTVGSKSWEADQAKLNALLDEQHAKYGPIVRGLGLLHEAWGAFTKDTGTATMRLLGEGLKVAADALKQFAPVANAAARALTPLMGALDKWVKGPDFKGFLEFFATSGVKALVDFTKFLGDMTDGFMHLMEHLAPVADAMGEFFAHLSGKQLAVFTTSLLVLGGAVSAAFGWIPGIIAGVVGLGIAFDEAYQHSAAFRNGVNEAFTTIKTAFGNLAAAAEAFWSKWGADITKFGVNLLKNAAQLIGHILGAVADLIAGILDVLTGKWSAAGKNFEAAAENIGKGLLDIWHGLVAPLLEAGKNLILGLLHGIEHEAGNLLDKAGSLANSLLKKFMDPFHFGSPSKVTYQHGVWIVQGLINGMESERSALQRVASAIAGDITQVTSKINADKSFAAAFAGNVFNAGLATTGTKTTTGLVNGLLTTTSQTENLSKSQIVTEMENYEKQQLKQAKTLKADVAKLRKEGLGQSLINQLEAAGPAGIPYMEALAAASKKQIQQLAGLNAKTNTDLTQAGAAANGTPSIKNLKARRRELAQEQNAVKLGVKDGMKGLKIQIVGSSMRVVA